MALATPRYQHWHHAIEKAAIDKNFAIHFPILDMLFGTFYLPSNQWPQAYGINGHPVPSGYWRQFWYPFRKAPTPRTTKFNRKTAISNLVAVLKNQRPTAI